MPDKRRHRGANPRDKKLFAPRWLPALREATADLGWLLARGYSDKAAVKLVGDRFQLQRRQRMAVLRSACGEAQAAMRRLGSLSPRGRDVVVDGFNLIIATESLLSGGLLLRGSDGRLRDLASVHGTYRRVEETEAAIELLRDALSEAARVRWVLDSPVSNSGKLAARLREQGWEVELQLMADSRLVELGAEGWALASSDGPLMDRVLREGGVLVDLLAGATQGWVVDLGGS